MEAQQQIGLEEFWKLYEANDTPLPPEDTTELGGLEAELALDLPAPPWLRPCSRRDPFPPCGELLAWPANYPAGELADLTEAEAAEEDPARFVYSDAEMEAWGQIVAALIDEMQAPSRFLGPSFARIRPAVRA